MEPQPSKLTENPEPEQTIAGETASNPAGFEEIFHRYSRPVLSFICHLIGNRSGAEELTQETFIRAFCNMSSRRQDAKVSTWLFGIAHNVAREAIRQKYRNQRSIALDQPDLSEVKDLRQLPEENAISRDMVRKIQRALSCLAEDQRSVFLLKLVYGLRYEEICMVTGSSVGKLKTDLHRARLEMRRRLKPLFGERLSGLGGER